MQIGHHWTTFPWLCLQRVSYFYMKPRGINSGINPDSTVQLNDCNYLNSPVYLWIWMDIVKLMCTLVHLNAISLENGAILTFYDVTEIKNISLLEQDLYFLLYRPGGAASSRIWPRCMTMILHKVTVNEFTKFSISV